MPATDQVAGRTHPFFIIDNAVLDLLPTIKPVGFAVYAFLAKCADSGGKSFPAQKTIGAAVGITDRYVRDVLKVLVDAHLLRIDHRTHSNGDPDTCLYTLLPVPQVRNSSSAGSGPVVPEGSGTPVPTEQDPSEQDSLKKSEASVSSRRQQREWPDADPEPTPAQVLYREALWEYFGRDPYPYETEEVLGNLARYGKEKLCPSPDTFRTLVQTCRNDTKETSGKWPKTLKPLLNMLAEVTSDLRQERQRPPAVQHTNGAYSA